MEKQENILYIGSGNSALLSKKVDLSGFTVVCANNSWRLFDGESFDIWIHSGDFPKYNYPKDVEFVREISYNEYSVAAEKAAEMLNWNVKSPQHHLGYTIFFSGLYWIMMTLNPKKIGLLGFDHDYNPDKVEKWVKNNNPNIQNNFNEVEKQNINQWANKFFEGLDKDAFYGQSTPDPIRLGKDHLIQKFDLAKVSAMELNIDLVNYSPVVSDINTIKKEILNNA